MPKKLKFVPVHSFVDSLFFQELSDLKLNKFKLETTPQDITAYYNILNYTKNQSPTITLSSTSFDANAIEKFQKILPKDSVLFAPGKLLNFNTKEQFRSLDKNKFLDDSGKQIFDSIKSGEAIKNPSLLSSFQIISFSDLKKYLFTYWFAFPSLYTEWQIDSKISVTEDRQVFLNEKINGWLNDKSVALEEKAFFILDANDTPISLKELVLDDKRNTYISVGFIDTSTYENVPAWYLRNFLTMLLYYGYNKIDVLCYRFNGKSYQLKLDSLTTSIKTQPLRVTGWEKTSSGTLQPKTADLQSLLSPLSLSEQAVDLNLKLMKWRIRPDINLETVKEAKCLLLGAGTLGSYVARALLGWGVRNITFVDNGNVSFSNPVRQSLYNYEDCLDGGKPKAIAAAESLKRIFPSVNAEGYILEIPMLGHPVKDAVKEKKSFEKLVELVEAHDVIYLLMDSRESRWLPTILGNVKRKIVINAALGFDGYLVMRQGCVSPKINLRQEISESDKELHQHATLGCYFCNDVFVPSDSLTDRTLDQMCTVTRPGLALMASGIAVELMVSILQSKNLQYSEVTEKTILGDLPHQIRGFLFDFNNIKLSAPNYKCCSACSLPILKEFDQNGWDFLVKALGDRKYVEDLSGLSQVQLEGESAVEALDIEDLSDEDDW